MQREIKFRAWDGEDKVMIEWEELKDNMDLGKLLCNEYEQYDEYEVMQYAGLKDKNDVEIYEGDICEVKFSNDTYQYSESTMIYEVGSSLYAYRFLRNNKQLSLELSKAIKAKVIGNIYENPELLEVK